MSIAEKDRHFQAVKAAAVSQNWIVERTAKGHFLFKSPDKKSVVTAGGNYKDPHAIKNLVGRLRRYGFVY